MNHNSELLFNYLRDVFYAPGEARLDTDALDSDFEKLGRALVFFAQCVSESCELANALARGDLSSPPPPSGNEMAAPLKQLQASLRHLTWQTQQVARGDYSQHVDFMGDFSLAFNEMTEQLEQRQRRMEEDINTGKSKVQELSVRAYRDTLTGLYNRSFGMQTLGICLESDTRFSLIFADLDNLKYINDKYGHAEGDRYIICAADYLRDFSPGATVCRLGGDEFMLILPDTDYSTALSRMEDIFERIQKDEYLADKEFFYSISFGVVYVDRNSHMTESQILNLADERMYEHKRRRKKNR